MPSSCLHLPKINHTQKARAQQRILKNSTGDGFISSEDEVESIYHFVDDEVLGDFFLPEENENNAGTSDDSSLVKDALTKDIDPLDILNKAISGLNSCKEENVNEPPISPNDTSTSASSDRSIQQSLIELNCFAEELGCLSDTALLPDVFTQPGVLSISGSVDGFGSLLSESYSVTPPMTSGSNGKLCKGRNTKP